MVYTTHQSTVQSVTVKMNEQMIMLLLLHKGHK